MKFKITKRFNKENGHFLGYSLYYKPFLFSLCWKFLNDYSSEKDMNHDIVWLLSLNNKIQQANEYL